MQDIPVPSFLPRSAFLVARREIVVRLRSRVFAATSIILAAVIAGGILVAANLPAGTASEPTAVRVGFTGPSHALAPTFRSVASALGQTVTITDVADAHVGRSDVQAGTLDMAVSGTATAPSAVVIDGIPPMVEIALDAAAQDARLTAAGMSPKDVASIMAGVPFETLSPAASSGATGDQSTIAGLVVAILLFIAIATYGNLVAQGVVEEKASRIIEVLLATVPPAQLLAGKIVGIGLVALLQFGIAGAAAVVAGSLTHAISIPALGLGQVVVYLAWFVLGFLLYAAAFATAAALVSRQEEVQSATVPVTLVLAGSYVLMFFALPEPSGTLSTVLSLLPPSAPIFMPMRIAAGAAVPWQVALSMALTAASIVGVVWLAGRIYANTAMSGGARVRFMDAFHG